MTPARRTSSYPLIAGELATGCRQPVGLAHVDLGASPAVPTRRFEKADI